MLVRSLHRSLRNFKNVFEFALVGGSRAFLSERDVHGQHAALDEVPVAEVHADARTPARDAAQVLRQTPGGNADGGSGIDGTEAARGSRRRGPRGAPPLTSGERKLDAAAAAVQVNGRKLCIAAATMRPDDEDVLAEVARADTANDNERADGSDVAGVVARILHFRAESEEGFAKWPKV